MLNAWKWFSSHKLSLGSHLSFYNPTQKQGVIPINRKFPFLSHTFKEFYNLGVETWKKYSKWKKKLGGVTWEGRVGGGRSGMAKLWWWEEERKVSWMHRPLCWRRKFPYRSSQIQLSHRPGHTALGKPSLISPTCVNLNSWQLCFHLLLSQLTYTALYW